MTNTIRIKRRAGTGKVIGILDDAVNLPLASTVKLPTFVAVPKVPTVTLVLLNVRGIVTLLVPLNNVLPVTSVVNVNVLAVCSAVAVSALPVIVALIPPVNVLGPVIV